MDNIFQLQGLLIDLNSLAFLDNLYLRNCKVSLGFDPKYPRDVINKSIGNGEFLEPRLR